MQSCAIPCRRTDPFRAFPPPHLGVTERREAVALRVCAERPDRIAVKDDPLRRVLPRRRNGLVLNLCWFRPARALALTVLWPWLKHSTELLAKRPSRDVHTV